mmetsp:Transcript_65853/g.190796  ORF Transcript_65853/g.190796 Transcript_65853/m.190796 type:complete len:96 (+) Transcript_65853:702-989(+)
MPARGTQLRTLPCERAHEPSGFSQSSILFKGFVDALNAAAAGSPNKEPRHCAPECRPFALRAFAHAVPTPWRLQPTTIICRGNSFTVRSNDRALM